MSMDFGFDVMPLTEALRHVGMGRPPAWARDAG
jgi:hypothetical protein